MMSFGLWEPAGRDPPPGWSGCGSESRCGSWAAARCVWLWPPADFEAQWVLGMVHLVEVVVEPGKPTCPPLAPPAGASCLRCAPHHGYAGA
jgi:hypothetical protein